MAFEIREIYEYELQGSLDFARAMFDGQIAYSLEAQDRDDFYKSTDFENVYAGLRNGSLYIYGGFAYGALIAVAAVSPSGKLAFFMVEGKYQNSGVEIELFGAIEYKCTTAFRISELSADVPQVLIPMFQFLGFQISGEAPTEVNSRFASMKYEIRAQYSAIPDPIYYQNNRKNQYALLAVVIGIVIAVIVAVAFIGVRIYNSALSQLESNIPPDRGIEIPSIIPFNDGIKDDDFADDEPVDRFSTIEEFIADDLSFTVNKEVWELNDDSEEGKINFRIEYPVLEGMADEDIQEKVNEVILSCAMAQRDVMYPEMSETIKDLVGDDKYRLESVVKYKITYLDENVMSVAFSDHYLRGSVFAEFYDMRTRTFDLRTGERCELEDLLFPDGNVDDQFIDDFRERMIAESPDSEVFRDVKVMSNDTIRRILLGEIVDGRYYCSYFVKERGLEMCVTYHFRSSDENIISRGWITTHYNYDDLLQYEKQHDLWEVLPR